MNKIKIIENEKRKQRLLALKRQMEEQLIKSNQIQLKSHLAGINHYTK